MTKFICLILLSITWSNADAQCFTATAADSSLRFEFAIERSKFTGHFNQFSLQYCWQDTPENGAISVKVDMTSVTTGNKDLDIGMQDREGLNSEQYPDALWQTESIKKTANAYLTEGQLTIRGISRQQSGNFNLQQTDIGWQLQGKAQLDRLDYDLGIGEYADTDFIPNDVTVYFDFKLKAVD